MAWLHSVQQMVCYGSAAVTTALAAVLAWMPAPRSRRWMRWSMARWFVVFIFVILSVVSVLLAQITDMEVLKVVTMGDTIFQTLLLAWMIASLIAPRHTKDISLVRTVLPTVLVSAAIVTTGLFFKGLFPYSLAIFEIYFAWQMYYYGRKYLYLLKDAAQTLTAAYDEEESALRLRPITCFIFSAIGVGMMFWVAFLFPLTPAVFNILVVVYTVYYTSVCIVILRYRVKGYYIINVLFRPDECLECRLPEPVSATPSARGPEADSEPVTASDDPICNHYDRLEEELRKWTARRGYIDNELTVEQLAAQMGVTRNEFITYFQQVHNTTFRSWRLHLRLEEAERLIRTTPELRVSALYELVGFNDRSNFHNKFTEFTGLTPVAYQQQFGAGRSGGQQS